MPSDYYFDLGIPFNADLEVIRKAYRQKAFAAHPDHGGSHEAMLRINEAYEILSNPVSRRHYDEARANQYNQTAQYQAQTDASQARQQASEYPRQWTDFESWLARDFTEAEYGQWGWLPTVGKSSSGVLFIIIGLVTGGIAAYALAEADYLNGKPLLFVVALGGIAGQWLHKQIGNSMRRPVAPQSQSPNNNRQAPYASQVGEQVVIRCPQCSQQLRVPASTSAVQVRCPSCQFQFDANPPCSAQAVPLEPSRTASAEKAAHDTGVGFAVIIGVIAFIVLIFVCKSTVDGGFFSDSETFINWPGVFIGTGICAFIAYQVGKKL